MRGWKLSRSFSNYTPRTNVAMENGPFEDVFPIEMLIFHGHVSLVEGIYFEYVFLIF